MACKGCPDKEKLRDLQRTKRRDQGVALTVTCFCGLARFLPDGLREGDKVELPPCPQCSVAFRGTFMGSTVQEIS